MPYLPHENSQKKVERGIGENACYFKSLIYFMRKTVNSMNITFVFILPATHKVGISFILIFAILEIMTEI